MLPAQKAARTGAAEGCLGLLLEALEGSLADVYGTDNRGSRSGLYRISGRAGPDVAPK